MKCALQIYGVFRTFETCLPQILQYILYHRLDYDVYILSQRDDGYSPENEAKIRKILGPRIVMWKYIEDYPEEIKLEEERYCQHYQDCVALAQQQIQKDLVTNQFVTRLWYRRWLNNQMRKMSKQRYDWVVRTRFDIGYRRVVGRRPLTFLNHPPEPQTIYLFPDILSCGASSVIDYESDLIHHWPYIYHIYQKRKQLPNALEGSPEMINKWLFMSEINLITYLKESSWVRFNHLPLDFKIVRPTSLQVSMTSWEHEHVINIFYGIGDCWKEVTDLFWKAYANHFDTGSNQSTLTINNAMFQMDPCPGLVKNLVIETLEGNEYFFQERKEVIFKYQFVVVINYHVREIKRITYGLNSKVIDLTQRMIQIMMERKRCVYVTNQLAGVDPCPDRPKILTFTLHDGRSISVGEYSLLIML